MKRKKQNILEDTWKKIDEKWNSRGMIEQHFFF